MSIFSLAVLPFSMAFFTRFCSSVVWVEGRDVSCKSARESCRREEKSTCLLRLVVLIESAYNQNCRRIESRWSLILSRNFTSAMDLLRVVDKFSGILSLANVRGKADDFLIDRLSSKFTTGLLCAFAILCGMKSSYTVPIICWIPAQLRRYERAITAYCYANNTYYVADHLRVPPTADERYESLIIYYQWLVCIHFSCEFGSCVWLFFLALDIWCSSFFNLCAKTDLAFSIGGQFSKRPRTSSSGSTALRCTKIREKQKSIKNSWRSNHLSKFNSFR